MMTAKEYLSQAWDSKMRIEAMKEQLAFLKSAATNISSHPTSSPVSGTKNIHKTEDAIIRFIDYEDQIKKQYAKLDEITSTINSVKDLTAQVILIRRYLSRERWNKIACTLYMSSAQVFRLHNEALAEIEKLIANESK